MGTPTKAMKNQNISEAFVEDAAVILALQQVAYQSEAKIYNDFRIPPLTQTLEELKNDFANAVFLKAEIQGRDYRLHQGAPSRGYLLYRAIDCSS